MKFSSAVDVYLSEMRAEGRINSDVSERSYRDVLNWHGEDVQNRDPRYTNRDDVKRTLARWSNPNTRAKRRSYLVSFYDWMVEEGMRPANPARQTRKPKRRPVQVYKLTRDETLRVLEAPRSRTERWAVWLLACAGVRSKEARGLQGRHFARDGWVHVAAEIAKGGRERWIPVLDDLAPIVDEIRGEVGWDEFVLPKPVVADPGVNTRWMYDRSRPCSQQYLWSMVAELGRRARVAGPIGAHSLRHAFTDHVARSAGERRAQAMLGHADISTTGGYMSTPTLDELAAAVKGVSYFSHERAFQGLRLLAANPQAPPAGFEPAVQAARPAERKFAEVVAGMLCDPRFREAARGMVS